VNTASIVVAAAAPAVMPMAIRVPVEVSGAIFATATRPKANPAPGSNRCVLALRMAAAVLRFATCTTGAPTT